MDESAWGMGHSFDFSAVPCPQGAPQDFVGHVLGLLGCVLSLGLLPRSTFRASTILLCPFLICWDVFPSGDIGVGTCMGTELT